MAWVRRGVISSCQALGCLATGSVAYSAVHWQLDPDASESHTVRSAVTCSFTNAGMRLFSQWSQADFRAAKKSAGAINELLLLELTREAAKTQYGKDFKLGSVTSRESFVALHPITTHEHYAPYIERVMNGETNVMFAEDVRMIAATSGTSGTQKLLPIVRSNGRSFQAWDRFSLRNDGGHAAGLSWPAEVMQTVFHAYVHVHVHADPHQDRPELEYA